MSLHLRAPMLPVRPSRLQKLPNLMEKGLVVLQSMADRDRQAPDPTLPGRQRSVSKPAQAVRWSFRKRVRAGQEPGGGRFSGR